MGINEAIFGDLLLSTLNANMEELNNNSLSRTSLTKAMLEDKAIYESGKGIEVKFRKERLPTGAFERYDQRPIEHRELYTGGSVGWKLQDVTVAIDEQTLVENSGLNIQKIMQYRSIKNMPASHQHTLFDLFHNYNMAAVEDLDNLQAKMIFGNGVDEEGNYKAIEGFEVIMAYDQPYAGLDPSDERIGSFDRVSVTSNTNDKIWNPRRIDLKGERPAAQTDFSNLGSDIRRGGKTGRIYVCMPHSHFNEMEYWYEGDKNRDQTAVRLGYEEHIYYPRMNMTFYPEDYLEPNADGTATFYGWMPKYVKLVKNKDLSMQFSGVMRQTDVNAVVYRYTDMCNLRCDSRAHTFRIDNAPPK